MPEYSNYLESLDPVVGALSGDEIIGASKDGDAVSLTAQQIADLGGGGGGTWGSITGTLSDQTDLDTALGLKAPLASPAFTGTPTVPTAAANTNNTQAASTAYADAKVVNGINNGATTTAPSEDAVFDALALKANLLTTYRRETASYTLDATDLATINSGARLVIEMNVGSANTLTIPPHTTLAFPIGTKFWVKQYGAGPTSFVPGALVDLRASAGILTIGSQYGTAIFEKIANNEWYIENGDPSVLQSTYTPTLNNTTNVAASTAYVTGYFRVGNMVTVAGKVSIDTTAAASTATLLGMSLPIASNLAAEEDLAGTAVCGSTAQSVRIMADATNDRASFSFLALATTNDNYSFTFSYLIK